MKHFSGAPIKGKHLALLANITLDYAGNACQGQTLYLITILRLFVNYFRKKF